jgi:hypothetical protein
MLSPQDVLKTHHTWSHHKFKDPNFFIFSLTYSQIWLNPSLLWMAPSQPTSQKSIKKTTSLLMQQPDLGISL